MKKILLFLSLLFFVGCDINYSLVIDKNYKENINITEDASSNYGYSGMSMVDYKDYYLHKEIPYHYDDMYTPEDFERFDDVSYYAVKDISDYKKIGLNLKANFKDSKDYSKSYILRNSVKNIRVTESDGKYRLFINNFKVFEQYRNLNKISISLKTKYRVTKHNADKVDGNNYYWTISRDNYSKSIIFAFDTNGIINNYVKNDNPMFTFTVCFFTLLFVFGLICLFIKKIYNNRNKV